MTPKGGTAHCAFNAMELILASGSPRRRQLLELMGLQFRILSADIDETMDPAVPLAQEIGRVSLRKALAVAPMVGQEAVIIAADTLVCVDGKRLGKPQNEAQAVSMLQQLSGRSHTVMTGVSVVCAGRTETFTEETSITFRPLCDAEIRAYVATGAPLDKAGAYGIQDMGALFASTMNGDYYNVMGLPICRLAQVLRTFGVSILNAPAPDAE